MEINIPGKLYHFYKESHRNPDMALMTLMDSFDQNTFEKVFDIVDPITTKQKEDVVPVRIGDSAIAQIKNSFTNVTVNDDLIISLLWIAVLFPEI